MNIINDIVEKRIKIMRYELEHTDFGPIPASESKFSGVNSYEKYFATDCEHKNIFETDSNKIMFGVDEYFIYIKMNDKMFWPIFWVHDSWFSSWQVWKSVIQCYKS